MESYEEYRKRFMDEIRTDSYAVGTDAEEEFLGRTVALLEDYDIVQDICMTGMGEKRCTGQRLMRIDGYGFDQADQSLELFISDFQDNYAPENITVSRVDELYWRMYYFLDEAFSGRIQKYYDDSDEILKIADLIRRRVGAANDDPQQVSRIKMFILTNKPLSRDLMAQNLMETKIRKTKGSERTVKSAKKIKKGEFGGKPLEIALWDLERFYDLEQSSNGDPVVIDFLNDFAYPGIPCIKGSIGEDTGYDAYIGIIPGKVLADIYIEHGSRVLEGNVRAFLGTGGGRSVNSGIRNTINNEPDRFFTYNNGIATTAKDVETELRDGQMFITKIVDLQIINGGQTTASLAEAVMKRMKNASLSGIFVPVKVTVIEDRETVNVDGVSFYDEMVHNIARYANSQNKVTAADLFSNDPFHIWMEQTSKRVWAPAGSSAVSTKWFYERTRKKYQQEEQRSQDRKKFAAQYPKAQKITTEELAKYMTAVADRRPDIVARGKNFAIKQFNKNVSDRFRKEREAFNDSYFKKCVCAAILYRSADAYLETNKETAKNRNGFWYKAGGNKGEIVPYTVAKILNSVPAGFSVDWDSVWERQALSESFKAEIARVSKMTNDFICDSHSMIVRTYCQKSETWEAYAKIKYELSAEFKKELIPEAYLKARESAEKKEIKATAELNTAVEIVRLGAEYWQNLLDEAAAGGHLYYNERTYLEMAVSWAKTGKVANSRYDMARTKKIFEIRDRLNTLGIK